MTVLYLVAAILGWPLVLFFILFAGDDAGGDGDLDIDIDADVDIEVGEGQGAASLAGDLLSIRSLAFFLALFGATGLVLGWLDANGVVTLVAALALGAFALWINATLMRYIRTSSVTTELSDRVLEGRPARVVLPVAPNRRGRVSIDVQGQVVYLVARPYRDGTFDVGTEVVVVEVDRGAALVASLEELNR
jgi:membrane protein implicated in regulation of membrane protease activity